MSYILSLVNWVESRRAINVKQALCGRQPVFSYILQCLFHFYLFLFFYAFYYYVFNFVSFFEKKRCIGQLKSYE